MIWMIIHKVVTSPRPQDKADLVSSCASTFALRSLPGLLAGCEKNTVAQTWTVEYWFTKTLEFSFSFLGYMIILYIWYIILYYIIYIYICVCTLCIYIYTCIELSPEMGTSECWRAVSGKTCNKYHLCNNLWFWLVKPMDQASCTMAQQKTCHIYRDWPYSWKDLVLEFKYFWGIPL